MSPSKMGKYRKEIRQISIDVQIVHCTKEGIVARYRIISIIAGKVFKINLAPNAVVQIRIKNPSCEPVCQEPLLLGRRPIEEIISPDPLQIAFLGHLHGKSPHDGNLGVALEYLHASSEPRSR